jgi:hypothetical protein
MAGAEETLPAATQTPSGKIGGAGFSDAMDRAGIERQAYSPQNTTISDSGGAYSGALPADLAHVIADKATSLL